MKKWKLHIPEGVQDYLFDEYYNKKLLESKLKEFFSKCGYRGIDSPVFEYFDVFYDTGTIEQEKMYKFFDTKGRILVLRPDVTTPIARIAGTKLREEHLPLRVSYISNVFRYEQPQSGIQREFTQAGIELIGVQSPEADAEVISTAIMCLQNLGVKDFKLDLGQVEFFKGIIESVGLDKDLYQEEIEQLRELIDSKNFVAVKSLIDKMNMDKKAKNLILKLPTLYGKPHILKKAFDLDLNEKSKAALKNLDDICLILRDYGLEDYISVDLGMVQSLDYYTGAIFKGFVSNMGFAVLGGGRYDNLVGKFGPDLPATGFALGIKRILLALQEQNQLETYPRPDYFIMYNSKNRGEAFKICSRLRKRGYSAVMSITEGKTAATEGLYNGNAKNTIYVINKEIIELNDNVKHQNKEITVDELFRMIYI